MRPHPIGGWTIITPIPKWGVIALGLSAKVNTSWQTKCNITQLWSVWLTFDLPCDILELDTYDVFVPYGPIQMFLAICCLKIIVRKMNDML